MTVGDLVHRLGRHLPVRATGGVTDRVLGAEVTEVAYDSRRVARGDLFVAIAGRRADGLAFVPEAVERGAVAIVAESAPAATGTPAFVVSDARLALALLAAEHWGHPSREFTVYGVTGTNGKTTTTYILAAILDRAGLTCGRIGTVSYRIGASEQAAVHTTPEAPDLQRLLRTMVRAGCRACAMEVSSHALALRRVDALRFAGAVFTNLTRDHLDFHGDMASYMRAKQRLFDMLPSAAVAAVNIDDPNGAPLVARIGRAVTFGVERAADVAPVGPISSGRGGLSFEVQTQAGALRIRSPLIGQPNVYNILGAVALATGIGVPLPAIEEAVAALGGVPGRFELVSGEADAVTVVVDYAHTDDALKNLLESGRALTGGRLIAVFGCGGDRDRTKRPLMGAVAARLSDLVIVTSDNPRSEDPDAIIAEITRGMSVAPGARGVTGGTGTPFVTITDRATAIARAIREAEPGDAVIIAGKGHEKYQEVQGHRLPFDDVGVARNALAERRLNSVT